MPREYPAPANDNAFVSEEDLLLEHAEQIDRDYPEVRTQMQNWLKTWTKERHEIELPARLFTNYPPRT
jgi:predicted DNA-binding protein (UPF0278 family)